MFDSANFLKNVTLNPSIQHQLAPNYSATHIRSCVCSACCVSTSADFSSDGSVIEEDFTLQSTNFQWQQPGGKGSRITLSYSYTNLLDGGVQGGISNGEMKAAIEEAFRLWSTYAPLEFIEVEDTGAKSRTQPDAADIRIGHDDLGGKGGTLGRTQLRYDGELATTVAFDNRDLWATDGNATHTDFLFVAVHEIGHALGLRHELTNDAVMQVSADNVYTGLGSAFLYADDINGIQTLYGQGSGLVTPISNIGAAPPSSPSVNPPATSPDSSPIGSPVRLSVVGSRRRDVLTGNHRNQTFKALNGNDIVRAAGGNDRLKGGSGNDSLYGESGNDKLWGETGNDKLWGGKGSDTLFGHGGRDRLIGVDPATKNPGRNERDVLTGGGGRDLFVLGDRTTVYYDDGRNNTIGHSDYALIKDFSAGSGDKIQLKGRASDYRIGSAPKGTAGGRGIFLQTTGEDELIAIVKSNTGLALKSSAFRFV